MRIVQKLVVLFSLFWSFFSLFCQTNSWTQFRGTDQNCIADTVRYPVKWSETDQIKWKTEIPGEGWSSPVVYENEVWITSHLMGDNSLIAACVDLQSGKLIHEVCVFKPDSLQGKHSLNTHATPTPCVDELNVYVHFGTYGTAAIERGKGAIVWKRDDLRCEHVQGPGSSPVLYKDLLILTIEGTDVQYLIALDRFTGRTIWKTPRPFEYMDKLEPIGKKSYTTPLIVNFEGRELMISNGSVYSAAYEPETGKVIWWIVYGEDTTVPMPYYENGTVYFHSGFQKGDDGRNYAKLFAVDPSGTGDVTSTHVKWNDTIPLHQLSTPLIYKGLIYLGDSRGVLNCIDAETGKVLNDKRLRGKFYSSPVYANGKIYFCMSTGDTFVLNEGSELDIISENKLEGKIWATPAFVEGNIIIRTDEYLYRISNQ